MGQKPTENIQATLLGYFSMESLTGTTLYTVNGKASNALSYLEQLENIFLQSRLWSVDRA